MTDSNELSPTEAAKIAEGVYTIRKDGDWKIIKSTNQTFIDDTLKISHNFSLPPGNRFKGSSGGNIFRTEAGFGYLAEGVNSRKNELLIGIRGTVHALDWVTDAAQAIGAGPSGLPVHGGFQRTFESFESVIHEYFRQNRSNPSTIHIVGHSLGGALATLAADSLSERGQNVKLYTFGSPRVGTMSFSDNLAGKLDASNMFRVSNQSDPVTMVPIYPFIHVPNNSAQYLIPSWHGINFCNHFKDRYVSNVERKAWASLANSAAGKSWSEQAEAWLDATSSNGGVIQMYSAKVLWMIMRCLDWILGKAAKATGRVVGMTALGLVTIVDRLTMILHEGILESVAIAESAGKLISAIMKFMGRTVVAGTKLTVTFIRWVLDLLFRTLATIAYRALYLANI